MPYQRREASSILGLKLLGQEPSFNMTPRIISGFQGQRRSNILFSPKMTTPEGSLEPGSSKEISEAQKILDDLLSYYNEQRIHEETGEDPAKRWQEAVSNRKAKLRPLVSSTDLDRIFSIHLKRVVRKDGSIMSMGKKWSTGCLHGTPVTLCLIPNQKFMLYKEGKKLWEIHL